MNLCEIYSLADLPNYLMLYTLKSTATELNGNSSFQVYINLENRPLFLSLLSQYFDAKINMRG
jgi:hypothetical protein